MHRFSIRDKVLSDLVECSIDKWVTSIYCSFTQGDLIIDGGGGGNSVGQDERQTKQLQTKIMQPHMTPTIDKHHQLIKPPMSWEEPYVVDTSDLKSVIKEKCSGFECCAKSCVEEPLKDTFPVF